MAKKRSTSRKNANYRQVQLTDDDVASAERRVAESGMSKIQVFSRPLQTYFRVSDLAAQAWDGRVPEELLETALLRMVEDVRQVYYQRRKGIPPKPPGAVPEPTAIAAKPADESKHAHRDPPSEHQGRKAS